MSGWDTSSRPVWDPQDGPDNTQDLAESSAPSGNGWGVPARPTGGPPPEFFDEDYPPQDSARSANSPGLAQRNPGRHAARQGDPGQASAPSASGSPAGNGSAAFGFGDSSPAGNGFGGAGFAGPGSTPSGFGDPGFGGSALGGNDFGDPGFGDPGQGGNGFSGHGFGGSGSASGFGDPGFGGSGPGATGPQEPFRQEPPWEDFGGPDFAAPGPARREPGRPDFTAQEPTRREPAARPDYGATEIARRDSGRTSASAQRDRGQQSPQQLSPVERIDGYLAQRGRGPHGVPADRSDQDVAARMDPALKDFFDPQTARPGAFPGPDRGPAAQPYRPPGASRPGQAAQGNGPRSWDAPAPGRPGQPGQSGQSRQWDAPPARPGSGAAVPGSRAGRRVIDEDPPSGRGRTIVIASVLGIVLLIGGYLFLRNSGGNGTAANNTQPTVSASASMPAATPSMPTASKTAGKAAGAVYTLSTPATAGGYPQGKDPHFLTTATTTADAIRSAAVHGGATVTGNPVSAAYRLPTFGQVMTFVGYQGTFDPTTVMASLATLGATDVNKYSAGPNGGKFACATTPSTGTVASATVCVWVTTSTLGVTEFFSSTAPEVLTTHQDHGAAFTLNLRNAVETKKS